AEIMPLRMMVRFSLMEMIWTGPQCKSRWAPRPTLQTFLQQAPQDFVGIKVRLGNLTGGLAMGGIVRGDRLGAAHRFVQSAKSHDSPTRGNIARKARLLHERRLARGQIPHRAVAEPAAVRFGIDPLRTRELGPRFPNVAAKGRRISGNLPGIGNEPAVVAQRCQVPGVFRINVQGNLESRSGDPFRQGEAFPELMDFEAERAAVELHRPKGPPPARDGREPVELLRRRHRPDLEHDRLANGAPVNAARWNRAMGRADV